MWYSNMPPYARALWGHLRGHSKYNVHQSSILNAATLLQ